MNLGKSGVNGLQTEPDSVRPDERRSRRRKEISSCENSELFAVILPFLEIDAELTPVSIPKSLLEANTSAAGTTG